MSKRRKDKGLRRAVAERPCLLCGAVPSDPHHHPLRRSHGGTDAPDNLVPLCRFHHMAFHDGDHQVIELVRQAAPAYFHANATD